MTAGDPTHGANKGRGLGKGLAALLGETLDGAPGGEAPGVAGVLIAPIEQLHPNPYQPRQRFDEADLDSLAASIREKGIIQPLVVRPFESTGGYQIVAGERRWRAAQRVGLHEIPVVVRHFSDAEALEVALVENLQRRDLGPLEEADAYARLIREFGHRQEDVAAALGKSRSHVANTVRLLELPKPVKQLVADGSLSAGHARALLTAENPEDLAGEVTRRKLNVRQTERLVRRTARGGQTPPSALSAKDPNLAAIEEEVSRELGLKVSIAPRGQGGVISVAYQSLGQLDQVLARLRRTSVGQ